MPTVPSALGEVDIDDLGTVLMHRSPNSKTSLERY